MGGGIRQGQAVVEAAARPGGRGKGGREGGGGGERRVGKVGGRKSCSYWYPSAEAEASLCPYSAYGE